MKTNLALSVFCLASLAYAPMLPAQQFTQTIRGTVFHATTNEPLPGATIKVLDLEEGIGAISGSDGSFVLPAVPVGRRTLQCTYTGFEDKLIILMLTSAKEAFLEIRIREGLFELSEAVIVNPTEALNPLSLLSVRSIAPEETQYYPAAANDVGRAMLSLPGIQPSKDNENDIIIRGNSSVGLLWRLEGVDILNPNHFARKGGSGGGITIFSIGLMDQSDFSTGAFPAEYGNAFSGVFDLKFRRGNAEKREHTFRAGMIGLDLGSEGPFKKGGASYLFNYRYSTLGLLNKMGLYLVGERVQNDFQDLSFSLFFPGGSGNSSLKIWGVGGLSAETKTTLEDVNQWAVFADSAATYADSDMGVLGATFSMQPDEDSHLKITLAGMAQRVSGGEDVYAKDILEGHSINEDYRTRSLALAAAYSRNIGENWYFKSGFQIARLSFDLKYDTFETASTFRKIVDGKGNTIRFQPYVQGQWTPAARWTFNLGLHSMYFGLTRDFFLEPRLGAGYRLGRSQTLSLAYGLHSRHVPLGSYFTVVGETQPNRELPLIKAHHLVLAYANRFEGGYRFSGELYYQYLFDVPVETGGLQTYWMLNDIEGYAARALAGNGTGRNYGLDLFLEKSFRNNLFFLLSASVFESTYTPLNGKHYNTQYNARFTAAFTAGKEWNLSSSAVLQAGLKVLYNPGLPATPLVDRSADGPKPVYDESAPFSDKAPTYFRTDTRIAFRKNRPGLSWLLSLDIQNATNRLNQRPFGWDYIPEVRHWERDMQAGLVPLLGFQLDF